MLKKINTTLEELFTPTIVDTHMKQSSIEIRKDFLLDNNKSLENLSYIFSNEINHNNLTSLFSQLACYFEVGFLLQKNENLDNYSIKDIFSFSQRINITQKLKEIKLPTTPIFTILTTNTTSLLNHFELRDLDPDEKMNSFLIPLSSHYTIIMITQTAEPWLRLKMESLQKTLMKINFII